MFKIFLLSFLSVTFAAEKIEVNSDKINFVFFDTLKKTERDNYVLDFESVSKIKVPRVNFTDLIPTKTLIQGDTLYISYFALGEETLGAVDIVDIKDPKKPKLISSTTFTDLEFVDMKLEGDLLFLSGQKADEGAAVAVLDLKASTKPVLLKTLILSGYYSVKILVEKNTLSAYTETKGGKFVYDFSRNAEGALEFTFKSKNLGTLTGKSLLTWGKKKVLTSSKAGLVEIEESNGSKKNIKLPGLTMEAISQGDLLYLAQADGSLWVLDLSKSKEVGFLKYKNKFLTTNALSLKRLSDEENLLVISEKDGVRLILQTHF